MSTHNIQEKDVQTNPNLPDIPNVAATGISYFTPAQDPPAGTALEPQPNGKPVPKLFKPIKIRGMTVQNRIMVRQMSCLISPGSVTDLDNSSRPSANTPPKTDTTQPGTWLISAASSRAVQA